jgi:putative acetyltransferase
MLIHNERPMDAPAIHALTKAAFQGAPYSDGTEQRVVDALRAANALTLSLVAILDDVVVGHIAFSPVAIDGRAGRWFGLGPVSVQPGRQRAGIGSALIREGLDRLRAMGADGCVLLGDPAYYSRFGFASDPRLRYRDAPAAYFQRLTFGSEAPVGAVEFHPAFDVG